MWHYQNILEVCKGRILRKIIPKVKNVSEFKKLIGWFILNYCMKSSPSLTCGRCNDRHLISLLVGPSSAANTDVLAVGAVGPSPDPMLAIQQRGFRSLALDIVQEDQAHALAKRPIRYDLSVTPGDEKSLSSTYKVIKMQTAVFLVVTMANLGCKECSCNFHWKKLHAKRLKLCSYL